MKKNIWIITGLSLAANVWLLTRVGPSALGDGQPAKLPVPAAEAGGTPVNVAPAGQASASVDAVSAQRRKLIATLVRLDSGDIAGVRDQLRAAGADESLIYGVIDGILRIRYNQALRTAELENRQNGWWRGNVARGANAPSWSQTVMAPLYETMGGDPRDILDYSSRFDFLPPAKARQLAQMTVDFIELRVRTMDSGVSPEVSRMLREELQKDVRALLAPEELAEYDLRFSDLAAQNAKRFTRMQVREDEFRAIQAAIENLQHETRILLRGGSTNAEAARGLEQKAFNEIVNAVGYDRAIDYLWSGTALTTPRSAALTELPSPPYAGPVMQLAAETGVAAAAIHADPNLPPEAKRSALLALQQEVRPKLERILPAGERAALNQQATAWFDALGRGQYQAIVPRLVGDAPVNSQTISITSPSRAQPPPLLGVKPAR